MNINNYSPVTYIKNFFLTGHERSIRAKKNIVLSLIIKGISMATSFVAVPLTLNYVDSSTYGVWLTLSSLVAWFVFFDIGLTQGLRNKFAEAKAAGNDQLAQIYVSTTYAILGLIFVTVWIIFIVINKYLSWPDILNIPKTMGSEVSFLAVVIFTYFCLSFVFKIITSILLADQQPSASSLIELCGQVLSLIFIIILVKTTKGSLLKLGFALCISPLFVLIAANIILFRKKYRKYSPSFKKVRISHIKDLFNLGIIFFLIQIASIIQFQTANIIIARNFSTSDVTAYNIVYKYFGILYMVFSIFLTPFWSASTEAFHKGDISWIRSSMKRYTQLNIVMLLGSFIMLFFSDLLYRLWLGEGKVIIPFSLSLWGCVYYNIMIFGSKYVQFLNGISALRIQFLSSLVSPILYIGIVLILIKYFNLGVYSLFIGAVISSFNGYILAPIQYHLVINKKKEGIWIR
jgi:O-antigen/teichoic acid export membrane protein